jgi:hypothetical protein
MKMTEGWSSLATANMALTSFSPSPTWSHRDTALELQQVLIVVVLIDFVHCI